MTVDGKKNNNEKIVPGKSDRKEQSEFAQRKMVFENLGVQEDCCCFGGTASAGGGSAACHCASLLSCLLQMNLCEVTIAV